MNRYAVIMGICFFVLYACKDPKGNDFAGGFDISGTVYLDDTLSKPSQEVLLKGQVVQLKAKADSNSQNFMTSTKTDQYGNFNFRGLSSDTFWISVVRESDTLTFSTKLRVVPTMSGINQRLVLYPDASNTNILSIICRDDATKGLLNNVKVCLFTSSPFANASICNGSFMTGVTNNYGRVTFIHVPAVDIFINARDSIGPIDIKAKATVNMPSAGLRRVNLFLN